MQRDVRSLPKKQLNKLHNFEHKYPEELDTELLNSSSFNLLQSPETNTALQILEKELSEPCIITFHSVIDRILKDEITLRRITEITGYPGSGKTQFLFQICITVQLPKSLGGLGGEVIFIDTNKSFSSTRVKQLSEHFTNRIQQKWKDELDEELWFKEIMKHIYVFNCMNFVDLMACVIYLEKFLINKQVKLVVIDNLPIPLKTIQLKDRTTALFLLIDNLQNLSNIFNFSIVITNDFTTRVKNKKDLYYGASLGDTYFHRINSRIRLYKNNKLHFMELEKSMIKQSLIVPFNIF